MFKPWEAQFHAKFINFYITNRHANRVNMQTVVCTHLSSPFRSKWHMYVPLNAILLFLLDGPLRFQLDHHIIDFKISSDIIQHKKPREKSLDCHKDLAFNLDVLSLTSSITIGFEVFTKKELESILCEFPSWGLLWYRNSYKSLAPLPLRIFKVQQVHGYQRSCHRKC